LGKQLASYMRLTKSKYFSHEMFHHPVHGDIQNKFHDLIPMDETSEKILKCKDIPCNENNSNVCSICFSNKNRIIFSCAHKCCIMCSTRLPENKCPQCRASIRSKIIFN
jgi:L-lysine 2,3-aminomutase